MHVLTSCAPVVHFPLDIGLVAADLPQHLLRQREVSLLGEVLWALDRQQQPSTL
jgi:hypothetical protein